MSTAQGAPTAPDLIGRKRDGDELSERDLQWLVSGYLDGSVSEGQTAAWLMAGVLRGFTDAEARALTRIYVASGETLNLSSLDGITVDKHSTGGVADSTTLLVAPLVAAMGLKLVKLSGRGLGHTGGTLDKLESIPGFTTQLEPARMLEIAGDVGCVVAAQSERLVPADKALYALRDVTGTVASPALIAASVMCKKLASGADTIVLDVKTGDGAFMQRREDAVGLARLCTSIGNEAGRTTVALVTAMDEPLGRNVGNALEISECIELLASPPRGRLAEVALALAEVAVERSRAVSGLGYEDVRPQLERAWADGSALEILARMIAAQGGDATVCENPERVLPQAPVRREAIALHGGYIAAVPARAVGDLAAHLGAGRARSGEDVDHAVGVVLHVERGDAIEPGQALATIHARTDEQADAAVARLRELLGWASDPVEPGQVLLERIAGG